MTTTSLVVSYKNMDSLREACIQNGLTFKVIKEGVEYDIVNIEYKTPDELFYLGQFMGLNIGNKIWVKTFEK